MPPESMAEEKFSIFINFDNDLYESGEILDSQVHQSEINENELYEKYTVKNILLHLKIIMLVTF